MGCPLCRFQGPHPPLTHPLLLVIHSAKLSSIFIVCRLTIGVVPIWASPPPDFSPPTGSDTSADPHLLRWILNTRAGSPPPARDSSPLRPKLTACARPSLPALDPHLNRAVVNRSKTLERSENCTTLLEIATCPSIPSFSASCAAEIARGPCC